MFSSLFFFLLYTYVLVLLTLPVNVYTFSSCGLIANQMLFLILPPVALIRYFPVSSDDQLSNIMVNTESMLKHR